MEAHGPFGADGFFGSGGYQQFDGVLAMYHDQGLVPFKSLCALGTGVNFTAGLPVVRTSPDHGTAFDIAGKRTGRRQQPEGCVLDGSRRSQAKGRPPRNDCKSLGNFQETRTENGSASEALLPPCSIFNESRTFAPPQAGVSHGWLLQSTKFLIRVWVSVDTGMTSDWTGRSFQSIEPTGPVEADISAETELDRFDEMMHFDVRITGTVRAACDPLQCTHHSERGPKNTLRDQIWFDHPQDRRRHSCPRNCGAPSGRSRVSLRIHNVGDARFGGFTLTLKIVDPQVVQWLTGSVEDAPSEGEEQEEETDPRWAALKGVEFRWRFRREGLRSR